MRIRETLWRLIKPPVKKTVEKGCCGNCKSMGWGIRGAVSVHECKLKDKVWTPWFGEHHPIILNPPSETCEDWEEKEE